MSILPRSHTEPPHWGRALSRTEATRWCSPGRGCRSTGAGTSSSIIAPHKFNDIRIKWKMMRTAESNSLIVLPRRAISLQGLAWRHAGSLGNCHRSALDIDLFQWWLSVTAIFPLIRMVFCLHCVEVCGTDLGHCCRTHCRRCKSMSDSVLHVKQQCKIFWN